MGDQLHTEQQQARSLIHVSEEDKQTTGSYRTKQVHAIPPLFDLQKRHMASEEYLKQKVYVNKLQTLLNM